MNSEGCARRPPVLCIVIPCFNESEVLPRTAPMFMAKLSDLSHKHLIDSSSYILFVDDGSSDDTWPIILTLAQHNPQVRGIRQSRNRGHQNAVLAGLMEARHFCDAAISIDCDGQDDIDAMDEMVRRYREGFDVVYGVRNNRDTDSAFKRVTAQTFYKLLEKMGAEVIYNHADYRLMSAPVLDGLSQFKEVNIYLRGMVPLIGYKSCTVEYRREARLAGESHYPLGKMIGLALDGITSLSIKPLRMIILLGVIISCVSFLGIIWAIIGALTGATVSGWASTMCVILLLGGVQLICLGVIGEYVGKTYLEAKRRPRYIIAEKTWSGELSEQE